VNGYREFEFDLPGALLVNLVAVIDSMAAGPLGPEGIEVVPEAQGVYQLFLDDRLVYVGKTDAAAGLHKRLGRHCRKILHRRNLDPARVTFKAVRIFVFTAMDLEADLIRHYGGIRALEWNGSGFGSNDPGRERDTTLVKDENYDGLFPIDIDLEINLTIAEGMTVAEALSLLKNAVPYLFRYEGAARRSRRSHPDLENARVPAMEGVTTARRVLQHILTVLPPGWQATALPGYVILYKEDKAYPHGEIIARSLAHDGVA
jgi:hypothetical protein